MLQSLPGFSWSEILRRPAETRLCPKPQGRRRGSRRSPVMATVHPTRRHHTAAMVKRRNTSGREGEGCRRGPACHTTTEQREQSRPSVLCVTPSIDGDTYLDVPPSIAESDPRS